MLPPAAPSLTTFYTRIKNPSFSGGDPDQKVWGMKPDPEMPLRAHRSLCGRFLTQSRPNLPTPPLRCSQERGFRGAVSGRLSGSSGVRNPTGFRYWYIFLLRARNREGRPDLGIAAQISLWITFLAGYFLTTKECRSAHLLITKSLRP